MTGAARARLGAATGLAVLAVLLWRLGTGAFVDGLRAVDGHTLLTACAAGVLRVVVHHRDLLALPAPRSAGATA
ncbi:hypothetical protein TPA0910_38890 [Streptomyces hygroscopicus subsp. sporocinereus]|uniref:Uncharacterized protein n=1 Tax=Streptomyces hygroscopicus TaxID=1912 RepID=A0ABQ3U1F5_STRHY|nr:hypothetical protein [Streptomyces hygroscopicus]GHJ29456.1 hypothetical protein TPA0910_38890 [Streptomyces hygroscopicus]